MKKKTKKAKVSKNGKFIYLSEAPLWNVTDGLVVYLNESNDQYSLPIMYTDLIKGKKRYYLPEDFNNNIIDIEVRGITPHSL